MTLPLNEWPEEALKGYTGEGEPIFRQCCVCRRLIGEGDEALGAPIMIPAAVRISHGYCRDCCRRELEAMGLSPAEVAAVLSRTH